MNTAELKDCTGIVVGVSGGSDSMALLHMLFKMNLPVAAAHINHSLRPEADDEQRLVQNYCKELSIPCYCIKVNVGKDCPQGMSVEQYARQVRYTFFEKLCAQLLYSHIATAHHADDNTETFFLNMLRGCGTAGGIPERRVTASGFVIIRPVLDMKKEKLVEYCQTNSIPYVTDSTNFEPICARNVLRNEILPAMRRINPALNETVTRFIRLNAQDDEYLTAQAQQLLQENELRCSVLAAAPPALASRAVRMQIKKQTGRTISEAVTENILDLIRNGKSGAKTDIGGGHSVRRVYDMLLLDEQDKQIPLQYLHLGENFLPRGILTLTPVRNGADISKEFTKNLYVRSRQTGDAVKLKGRGTKTLKKLFSDAKIPVVKRTAVPIVFCNEKIVYVCGFGPAHDTYGGEGYKIAYFEKK